MTLIFSNLRGSGQPPPRLATGIVGLDRIAGSGGFVLGEVVLLSGDPGAGKSTLMLQAAASVARPPWLIRAAYVTGEETLSQVQDRASRLYIDDAPVHLGTTTVIEEALSGFEGIAPQFVVIDSIQVMITTGSRGQPGSPSVARMVMKKIVEFTHRTRCVSVVICHVTKGGRAAGPNTLQHSVDAVMHLQVGGEYRALRASKNRFGPTNGVGLFKMEGIGLRSVE